MNLDAKMETVTTFKATFIPPKSPGVRLRGKFSVFSPQSTVKTSLYLIYTLDMYFRGVEKRFYS